MAVVMVGATAVAAGIITAGAEVAATIMAGGITAITGDLTSIFWEAAHLAASFVSGRASNPLMIARNTCSPSREIAAHHQRNAHCVASRPYCQRQTVG